MAENGNGTKQTIVEEGTEIDGIVRSTCPVKVNGALKGDLNAPALSVTSSGSVKGQVKVGDLRSEGELQGQIDAENVVLSGRVSDATSIRAATIEVKLSHTDKRLNVTFGNVNLNIGDATPKKLKREKSNTEAL